MINSCHFSSISHQYIRRINDDMAGGWIKLLRPPSSTYLPRPSDIEFRSKLWVPEAASISQSRRIDDQRCTTAPPNPPFVLRPLIEPPESRTPSPRSVVLLTTDDSIVRVWVARWHPRWYTPALSLANPAGWMVLEGFTDWRPLWNAQEGCAAARTCVIRRLDRRRGSITIISIVCVGSTTIHLYHHRFPSL